MSRVIFKENKNGTYDLLDRDSNDAIYEVSTYELRLIYEGLKKHYSKKVIDRKISPTMVEYASKIFGYGEGGN